MPSPVDRYFKEVKDSNPSYSDEQAWATAWSIYCKHKNPGSEHCHQDEYLTGKSAGVIVRVASRFLEASVYSDEELMAMAAIIGRKSAYRAKAFDEAGLGVYKPDNPHIQSLVKKGIVQVSGNKIVIDDRKAQAILKGHNFPAKYETQTTRPWAESERLRNDFGRYFKDE